MTFPGIAALHGAGREPVPPIILAAAFGVLHAGDPPEEVIDAVRDRWSSDCPEVLPGDVVNALRAGMSLPQPADGPARLALHHSFPDEVMREWVDRLGEAEAEELAEALNREAPLSIRANTLRCTVDECARALRAAGLEVTRGSLSPFALMLPRRMPLDTVQPYRDGWFEVQDEGSQILALLLQPETGMVLIDACAGGGGKSLQLAALVSNDATIVAMDIESRKLDQLRKRAARAGARIRQVIHVRDNEPAVEALRGRADAVLVDAPCSALGTVRRNPALKSTWTPARSEECARQQLTILDSAARLVKPGGRLVYSTCTLVQKENEETAAGFLSRHPDFALLSAPEILKGWGISADPASPTLMLWPHRTGTDGFFAAVFRRVHG